MELHKEDPTTEAIKIDPSDLELAKQAKQDVAHLQVEIATINGFVTKYLINKYKFKTQEEFDKYFGD